ncbi:dipeptide epimerase [Sphingomonas suaedae]|uniref:Dipeptide epimerase n=1 Tax=Sphingomonas suaedae TaxID=2599297 RepID=A0A518RKG5_9SPHN|nr:dipeptide epimerase [Sphingomonas suaedae]QDX27941.1 dipeptide epimerase [Sphingomonas suaedae]
MKLTVARESLPLNAPFRIAGHVFETSDVVTVLLEDGAARGRGEASGVYYLGDDVDHMLTALDAARGAIEGGIDRAALRDLMPAGGARNAVDAALWELEADRAGVPVWQRAGIAAPKPVVTTFTLGADEPDAMAQAARGWADARAIKVKLTGEDALDADRVRAIRAARPDVWLGVDANQGYTIDRLDTLVAVLVEARVALLEQPLARGREADLDGYRAPIPIAGDESILTLDDVGGAKGRFDVINIKLDKCGGLTEALMMAERAEQLGLGVMVGNMVGTSLAMAPAFVLAQRCGIVDLDGPTFLKADRTPAIVYRDGTVWCDDSVWGPRVPGIAR